MESNVIQRGDCIRLLAGVNENSIDLAFADPPFNIGYEYDQYDDCRADEEYLAWSRRWMAAVQRVLRPWGAFWLAIGDEYAAELKVIATRELGYIARSWVVWYYTFGVHCTTKFTRSHAHLLYFLKPGSSHEGCSANLRRAVADGAEAKSALPQTSRKSRKSVLRADRTATNLLFSDVEEVNDSASRPRPSPMRRTMPAQRSGEPGARNDLPAFRVTFNDAAIRVPSARQLVYGDRRANPKGRLPDDTWILRPQDLPDGFTPDSDTWYFPRVCGTFKERAGFHGCQMPEQLLGRIISACSNEGDLVLDPFAGSGTTLAVAKKLGRRFLGIELSAKYVKEATARLKRIQVGQPLDGAPDPLTSVPDTRSGRRLRA